MNKKRETVLAYADYRGNVYEFPGMTPAFRSGRRFVHLEEKDLIGLPYGSYLFSMPERYPVFFNEMTGDANHMRVSVEGEDICAAASFLASGYLRTHLPGYIKEDDADILPLWAYAGLAFVNGEFAVPAIRIDDDPRSDPGIHENPEELDEGIKIITGSYPENRLVKQIARCSTEYGCLCARNLFIGRYEAPVPTTPVCNAGCAGCLSYSQDDKMIPVSQERLDFSPDAEEIYQVIYHHITGVENAVASFGQGCEGEPLIRADVLAESVRMVRERTGSGTININTNGSLPGGVRLLIDSGIDSIRISMNSPTEKYYNLYHRPGNYTYSDVLISLDTALESGIFVSLNLFFMPGFTDMESEVESLFTFLEKFPVNMIQTRNLNIDPDYYFDLLGVEDADAIGIRELLEMLRKKFPKIRLGYYNPPLRK